MQPYYSHQAVPPMMDPNMMRMQQMQQQQYAMASGMPGMPMQPGMMQPGMGGIPGMNPMVMPWSPQMLGYDYQLPTLGYKPQPTWGAWDLANAQYSGGRLERSFFDNIMSSLSSFFGARHLSEEAARDAHRRVYFRGDGEDAGNRTLGGAAAYQAYLIWDRDHYSAFHQYPSQENRERLVGLAVAELFSLWETVEPRSSRARPEDAAEYAAATAKHLFDRHYEGGGLGHHHHHHHHNSHGARRAYSTDDDISDSGSAGRRERRKSVYGREYGPQMPPMAPMGPSPNQMYPSPHANMPGGYGGGGFGGYGPGGYGGYGGGHNMGMGMGVGPYAVGGGMPGMPGGPMMGQQGQGTMGAMPGAMPGSMSGGMMMPNHGGMGEAPAMPGMHPYTYGRQSGVMYGSQPIDQMGNPTFPGGPERSWYTGPGGGGAAYGYGYCQPRYY